MLYLTTHSTHFIYDYMAPIVCCQRPPTPSKGTLGRFVIYSGVGRCQKVCVCVGGGGGAHRHIHLKNQYKRDVIEYMVIYVMVSEIFHKIINWYMKDAK